MRHTTLVGWCHSPSCWLALLHVFLRNDAHSHQHPARKKQLGDLVLNLGGQEVRGDLVLLEVLERRTTWPNTIKPTYIKNLTKLADLFFISGTFSQKGFTTVTGSVHVSSRSPCVTVCHYPLTSSSAFAHWFVLCWWSHLSSWRSWLLKDQTKSASKIWNRKKSIALHSFFAPHISEHLSCIHVCTSFNKKKKGSERHDLNRQRCALWSGWTGQQLLQVDVAQLSLQLFQSGLLLATGSLRKGGPNKCYVMFTCCLWFVYFVFCISCLFCYFHVLFISCLHFLHELWLPIVSPTFTPWETVLEIINIFKMDLGFETPTFGSCLIASHKTSRFTPLRPLHADVAWARQRHGTSRGWMSWSW